MNLPALLWPCLLGGAGLIFGSFVALLTVRLPMKEGVVSGRSRCPRCGRALTMGELVPLFSYAWQRGRCRNCGERISRRYPVIEAGCAVLGIWAGMTQPMPFAAVGAGLGWALLLIAIVDAEHLWLPDRLTLPLLAAGLVAGALQGGSAFTAQAIGASVGWAVLALLAIGYRRLRGREGLGGGDARLLAAGGAWVGWMGLPSVLVWASLAGMSVVGARVAVGRPVRGDDKLPFGTFLALGIWLTWLYGPLGR